MGRGESEADAEDGAFRGREGEGKRGGGGFRQSASNAPEMTFSEKKTTDDTEPAKEKCW